LTKDGAQKDLFIMNKDGLLPSMTTFLLQEVERFNNLNQVIAKSLDTLKKAIKGEAVMSDDIDKMYNSMQNNKVPEMWSFHAYPSLKPLSSWVENLQLRIEFIRSWLLIGKPISYWLPSLFFP
jgi:dynein heavy chain